MKLVLSTKCPLASVDVAGTTFRRGEEVEVTETFARQVHQRAAEKVVRCRDGGASIVAKDGKRYRRDEGDTELVDLLQAVVETGPAPAAPAVPADAPASEAPKAKAQKKAK